METYYRIFLTDAHKVTVVQEGINEVLPQDYFYRDSCGEKWTFRNYEEAVKFIKNRFKPEAIDSNLYSSNHLFKDLVK